VHRRLRRRNELTTPLLGFCIPTYRRPDQLVRCVQSIVRSAASYGVPIHVADDSADDTNVAAMAALRADYPLIVHHRNPENLGIDRNILRCVDLCDARHAWIMGEDDRVLPEAVPAVVRALEAGERPFVHVNYSSVDEEVRLVLKERSLELDVDVDMGAEDFLAEDAWSMGFIGACVVEKARWEKLRSETYVGTWFAHVGTIMEYLRGQRVHLIAKPLVLNRCGTPRIFTWKRSTFDVLHGWARMVDLLRNTYPADVCDRASESFRKAHGVGSIPFFAYLRADGALDPGVHDRHVRAGPYSASERGASWCIARMPPHLFRAARWALKGTRRVRNRRLVGP
jgi:glycosyltransferase involved in cell wall biosynthesis